MLEQLKYNCFMNKLNNIKRSQVITCLIEGCSIRSTVRMTGVAKKTVMRLLVEVGEVCSRYQDEVFRGLSCQRIQVDELWSFVYCKQKNLTPEIAATNPRAGDVWLWVALDADTKLVPSWFVGSRDADAADVFLQDLASRISTRTQLTTDGHKVYLNAVEGAFRDRVDYSMLIKLYGPAPDFDTRYSPGECTGCERKPIMGNPDPKHISTSFVERQNLTARMMVRRLTRLTNAFSKKLENHTAAMALYYFAYNFIKIHGTLRCTPAMAAGVTNKLWEVSDLVALWEEYERREERAA